ncbi:hypothetical protein PPSIR1_09575 [Plesiocystis pacifica SIR-1]|uniref:Uncharacterized protein n=1 Tax=Plesiocystis pacifica SIR-1 TaxID=391625 RepID=A6G9C1_9BACT|nr:hypothetical protein [Plesiocystis pacifica]EDM77543.1 hypothetical protein PPSIR1_09575 [Plesiocystis pacifica SIR-1]
MQRTCLDWLGHARAAEDPEALRRCLDAAIAEAKDMHDWRAVLLAAADIDAVPRTELAELADRTFELAARGAGIWEFRDVATVRKQHLDDEAGGRAALEACRAAFLASGRGPNDYEWVLLAKGFVETLGDQAGAREVLALGLDQARAAASAAQLCCIATAWAELVDREAGVALLREAEALGSDGSVRPWALANAWRAVEDADAVRRVLDGALARAQTHEAAIEVARAWASHRRREQAAGALVRVEALASSVEEWLAIGELALDAELGVERIRRAVERAEAAVSASMGADAARVSAAYLHWLGDGEAAERVGPRGAHPSSLRSVVDPDFLSSWAPSATALFDHMRATVTEEELTSIAKADYGMGAAKHLAALRDICESGRVPTKSAWVPHEVLELSRWAEGERVNHVERALSALLLCSSPPSFSEIVTNGVILAESCLALGPEVVALGERFFAWFGASVAMDEAGEVEEGDELDSDRALALLLLFILRAATSATPGRDPQLIELAERLTQPAEPLEFASMCIEGSMREALWERLLTETLRADDPPSRKLLVALGR